MRPPEWIRDACVDATDTQEVYARFKEFKVRFSAPVLPGDTLTTEGWRDGDGRYLIQVSTPETVVINNAYVLIDE